MAARYILYKSGYTRAITRPRQRTHTHTSTHAHSLSLLHIHTHTHTHRCMWYLLLLHGDNVVVNAPQCYVIRTLPLALRSSHLTPVSSKWSLHYTVSGQNFICISPVSDVCYVRCACYRLRLHYFNNVCWREQIMKLLGMLPFFSLAVIFTRQSFRTEASQYLKRDSFV